MATEDEKRYVNALASNFFLLRMELNNQALAFELIKKDKLTKDETHRLNVLLETIQHDATARDKNTAVISEYEHLHKERAEDLKKSLVLDDTVTVPSGGREEDTSQEEVDERVIDARGNE